MKHVLFAALCFGAATVDFLVTGGKAGFRNFSLKPAVPLQSPAATPTQK